LADRRDKRFFYHRTARFMRAFSFARKSFDSHWDLPVKTFELKLR
jgi:hypothetical protein